MQEPKQPAISGLVETAVPTIASTSPLVFDGSSDNILTLQVNTGAAGNTAKARISNW